MRGLIETYAQGLDPTRLRAARLTLITNFMLAQTSAFVMPTTGLLAIYAYAKGGDGGESLGTRSTGGGGGGAGYYVIPLPTGAVVPFVISDTIAVTLPSGEVLTVTPGQAGQDGYDPGGAGGYGTGNWTLLRRGGRGGGWSNPDVDPLTNDGVNLPAEAGEYGGPPGTDGGTTRAGGGPGGFTDLGVGYVGAGGDANAGPPFGFGGGGGSENNTDPAPSGASPLLQFFVYEET